LVPQLILYYDPRGRPHREALRLPRIESGATILHERSNSDEAFLRALALASRHRWREGIWRILTEELEQGDLADLAWAIRSEIPRSGHVTLALLKLSDGPDRRDAAQRCARAGLDHPKRVIDAFLASMVHAVDTDACLSRRALKAALGFRTGAPLGRLDAVIERAVALPGASPIESSAFWVALIRLAEGAREDERLA